VGVWREGLTVGLEGGFAERGQGMQVAVGSEDIEGCM